MNETESESLTSTIEDGTYYIAARRWYSDLFHSPIAERTYYIITTALSIICLLLSLSALIKIHPVSPRVAFAIYAENTDENIPRIKKLATSPTEDKNTAVMKYMIGDYVTKRESYDLSLYELRYRNIWSHSTDSVFNIYKKQIDASNPLSPYHQYTDVARRAIDIDSITYDRGPDISHAVVIFDASVISTITRKEIQHSKWQATLTYRYTDFKVTDKSDSKKPPSILLGLTEQQTKGSGEKKEVIPMTFTVSDYQVKELLE